MCKMRCRPLGMRGTRARSGAPAGSTRDTLGAWSLACCCLAWARLAGWDGHSLAWPSHWKDTTMVLIRKYCSSKVNLYSSRKTVGLNLNPSSSTFHRETHHTVPPLRLAWPDQTSIPIYHPSSPRYAHQSQSLTQMNPNPSQPHIVEHSFTDLHTSPPLVPSSDLPSSHLSRRVCSLTLDCLEQEVSKEYKLGPDTLYLTVDMIDRFLSFIYIEKQRLQLLGVACMLIASKYEEICTPRVEDFCFITDNNYSREEVINMESEVLNHLHFQLSIPTTETFLRRFIQAAQSSNKKFYLVVQVPCVQLEFLENCLAELTLVDYSFLNFLPSLVAAFDVFLARWTFIQSDHPWLKTTIIAMENLQRNTNGYSLNAIREKYKQLKRVVTLTSKQPVVSLF
ncbi:hypothetical protein UlMin_016652 [Ulmus minor]